MDDYIQVTCTNVKPEMADIIIAMLADIGFESFEESENSVTAYISKAGFEEPQLEELSRQFGFSYQTAILPPQNWNAVWESNFEPVIIDDFVAVRAHFHEPIPSVLHEIIITPKMSFGTGHHATTTMMIQQMRELDFSDKTVFDFGTGTGILSILAEKLGAKDILAIDNDEWSIENSLENIVKNNCQSITTELRNDANVNRSFDIILANINRNVILDNIDVLYKQLNIGGHLLLSGLLSEDEKEITAKTSANRLHHLNTRHRLQWISMLFSR